MTMPRVSQGQPFRPSASAMNRTAAAVEEIERIAGRLGIGSAALRRNRDTILAKNDSVTDIPMFGVVSPKATLFVPSENLGGFQNDRAIKIGVPSATTLGLFGIALEPIAEGRIGRVVFSGLVVVQVEITDPDAIEVAEVVGEVDRLVTAAHGTARIIAREAGDSGTVWALVQLGVGRQVGIRWVPQSSSLVGGSDPAKYKYTLKRATSNAFGTVAVASTAEVVYAYNDYEDQDNWGHGQSLAPGGATALTPGPVLGPVQATFADAYDSDDGTPIYRFDAPCPMTSACEATDDSGGTVDEITPFFLSGI